MIIREQAVAFDHHDVQSVMGVVQNRGVAAVEQVIEHALRALADLRHGHALGEILLGVEMTETADAFGGIGQAGAREAPGADRCADQRPFAWRGGQPFAEQRQVQALNSQRLGPASSARQCADIGGVQTVFSDAREGAGTGLEGQGRELDVDGGHTGLDVWQAGDYKRVAINQCRRCRRLRSVDLACWRL
ncbi:Transcriptional regulator [Pseudomonas sp. IT-P171]